MYIIDRVSGILHPGKSAEKSNLIKIRIERIFALYT